MENKKNIFLVVFYSLIVSVFPAYILYLFLIFESASFSVVSKIFIGFMIIIVLFLFVLLFFKKARNFFMIE